MRKTLVIASILVLTQAIWLDLSGYSQIRVDPSDHQVLIPMVRWWMPNFGDGDHMSSTSPSEQPPGGVFEGQTHYLRSNGDPAGTQMIYSLLHSGIADHMESYDPAEGGYTLRGPLGVAHTAPVSGTCGMRRWNKPAILDHMTGFCNEDPSPDGYQAEGFIGFAFPRHGNFCEVPFDVSGAQVRVTANLAAGGAISELVWNGKQFVNAYDYGREIQVAVNFRTDGTDNPTEGGDQWGCPGFKPAGWAHGSPLLSYNRAGPALQTLTSPLQWRPQYWGGGEHNPVRWLGTIGKLVTLDFLGRPNVMQWNTTITLPSLKNYADLEIATAYLNSEFSSMYLYDAASDTLNPRSVAVNACNVDSLFAGAAVLATSDSQYALGIYRSSTPTLSHFGLCNFLTGSGGGKFGGDTTKSNVRAVFDAGLAPGS